MPLDAYSEALLAARRKAAITSVAGQTVEEVRASRAAWRNQTEGATIEVNETRDLLVPADGWSIPVRIYRPSPANDLPVIAYFHGGGWVIGDLDHSDLLCRWLCRDSGCVVVNVDYRLAPEHKYPAAAEDAYSTVTWLGQHAGTIGGDPYRLAVAGASAGGNLAAVAALMARDRGGPPLRAQLLVYPVTDEACDSPSFRELADGYIVSTEDMRWYWQQYLERPDQGREPYASPLRAETLAGLPPTLVITAEYDCVRDDGERYAQRLIAAGVEARLARYTGTLHGFFATPGTNDAGARAVAEGAAFLRDHLFRDRT
jgi:acetyl esterase